MGSHAGTFVNSRLLRGRCRLQDGDYLCPGGGKTLVKFCLVDELEERALRTSFELMLRDPLTRLYNRRYFDDRLFSEFAFARREELRLALLVIDLDDLARHRAEHGYHIADAALNVVAGSALKLMRPDDILTRYEGDAFALLARGTSLRNVSILADRLCQQIRALSLELPDRRLRLSVSVGLACLEPGQPFDSAHALLDAAKVALFRAKAAERERA